MSLHATTSQTVGPYLHIGLTWLITEKLAPAGVPGKRISIEGRVLDGDGKPVNDALVEIWQADSKGRYGGKRFRGFGRSATDDAGGFRFHTIQPGRVPGPGGKLQAPGYTVADAGATVRVTRYLDAFVRVLNLFDRQYEEALGFPALGRHAMAGIRVAARR